MDKFLDRFKPKKAAKKGLAGLFGNKGSNFSGQGQSLGGKKPGKVIDITLPDAGPLGIYVEKNPNNAAIVSRVTENSQSARVGMERGDVLCFADSDGQEEIQHDMFMELAKSNQRPLCLQVRRVPKTKVTQATQSSADNFARRQAVIAAAEAREKAHKKKTRPIPKTDLPNIMSTAEKNRIEAERLANLEAQSTEPMSEEARKAVEAAKNNEAATAASLGYNPYETNKSTAGQARNATVAVAHGAIQNAEASLPSVAPPQPPIQATREHTVSADFAQAYEAAVTTNDNALVVNSFGIMRKLLTNATTKGQDSSNEEAAAKFRKVRLGNTKIKAAIVDVEGALDMMLSAGFQLVSEGDESMLVYPAFAEKKPWLDKALSMMEKYENL